jgi:hypothetical protein
MYHTIITHLNNIEDEIKKVKECIYKDRNVTEPIKINRVRTTIKRDRRSPVKDSPERG